MGNHVLFRGIVDGKRVKKRFDYNPRLYVTTPDATSEFRTLDGKNLKEIKFQNISDCRDFKKKYQGTNVPLYGDNRHEYSFISDYYKDDVEWNFSDIVVAYIDIEVGSEDGFPEPEDAFQPVTAITIWIKGKFHVFGYGNGTDQVYTTDRQDVIYYHCDDEKDLIRQFIKLWSSDYPDIVTGWNACRTLLMKKLNAGFDIQYIINRMERLKMGEEGENLIYKLSPWGIIKSKNVKIGKDEATYYSILGVACIDYLDMYLKFSATPSQENYKLDHIGSVEVGTKKIDYSEYESLYSLYTKNYQKFIDYNIGDVELVMKIEAKNALIEQIITLAYDARVNYEDVFSQVRMWDTIIMNYLSKLGIMMPPKKENIKNEQFEGGYVKEPKPGLFEWVASFDFTSLYPMLIMMFNLSPETLLDPVDYPDELADWMQENRGIIDVETLLQKGLDTSLLKNHKVCLTPNKQFFKTDIRGFLPEILDRMYKDRAMYKKKMNEQKKLLEKTEDPVERLKIEALVTKYNNLQSSKKIQLNSSFGACGNQYFRFYDVRIAEAITLSARLSVIWIQRKLNKFIDVKTGNTHGDYVIASDTDSVYVTFKNLVDMAFPYEAQKKMSTSEIIKNLDKLCEGVVAPKIRSFCQELADYTNAYEQKLDMKREALADKAIWVKKKNYMINVYNNEGIEYAKPKLKIVGMAAIKSSTPAVCKLRVKEAYETIINSDVKALREFNDKFREEFMSLPVQDIASPIGMNGLEKYTETNGETLFKKKTPVHVKGSIVFNDLLRKKGLLKKYQLIKEGEKLKYVYLKAPNPIQSEVISFTTVIPKEFELEPYIDYQAMYEKNYMAQITRVTDVIGWQLEEKSSLEHLFA